MNYIVRTKIYGGAINYMNQFEPDKLKFMGYFGHPNYRPGAKFIYYDATEEDLANLYLILYEWIISVTPE